MRRAAILSVAGLLSVAACKQEEAKPAAAEEPAAPAAPAPAAAEEPEPEPEQAFVTYVTGLRREPTESRKVETAEGKKVSNWVASLYRGEEVTVLKVQEEWAFVRASDDTEGWLKKEALLPVEGVTLATVFEETKTFGRPDLVALNSGKTLEPGTLLFVLKSKDQFSEINHYGRSTQWVLSEKLNTDANEIAASKLLNKVRWLEERKDPAADQVMELARSQFGSSKLIGLMEAAEAEPEAEAEAGAEGQAETAPGEGEADSAAAAE